MRDTVPLPVGAVALDRPTRLILAHLLAGGDPRIRTLSRVCGRSLQRTHDRVTLLSDLGLVDWEPAAHATLHVTVTAHPAR